LINAVGLANPGVDVEILVLARTARLLKPLGAALIASIFAGTVAEFAQVASHVASASPDLIEVNISCPNVHDEYGTPFSSDPQSAAEVTAAVKEAAGTNVPVLVKLSPNVADISGVARAVEAAGADGITAINTLTGMLIDVHARRPTLANRMGGISGPAILPLAIRCVYDIYQAVSIPIIGMGGVSSGQDAVAMIMAGATAVGVGSAVYGQGPEVFGQILAEMEELAAELGYGHIAEMRGVAHR
jgi:dihydroorotate dehydrogenase (NAD+) catalytic subunit